MPAPQRLLAIDLTRGLLMALIALSHAMTNMTPGVHPALPFVLHTVLSGTVGFTTVSGLLVGWFLSARPGEMPRLVRRYRTQAIRLLLLVHPLLAAALWLPYGKERPFLEFLLRTVFITDVLAVLFFAVVPFMGRLSARARLGVGVGLLVVARLIDLIPAEGVARLVREILAGVGPSTGQVLYSGYAFVSLAGMFFVGSYFGTRHAEGRFQVRRVAPALIALTVAFAAVWALAKQADLLALKQVFYPAYYLTTYPVYLAETLIILVLFSRLREAPPVVGQALVDFGRAPLVTYVVQYLVMQTLPALLGWNDRLSPAATFAFAAAGMVVLAALIRIYRLVRA